MDFVLWGINHRSAPLKVRERFSFSCRKVEEILMRWSKSEVIDELVVLSTCNRTEVYVASGFPGEVQEFLREELHLRGYPPEYFYFLQNKDMVRHLFYVASGIDSQVMGENQILSQVKEAYFRAKEAGSTGKHFNKLFQKAMEVGKIVRRKTKISAGNVSVGSVALKMVENLWGGLEGKRILIIGTGKIGELVARYLTQKGISGTFVANRTYKKAVELAGKIGGKAVRLDNLRKEVESADIVISATSSPHLILKKKLVQEVMRCRKEPLCMMDLALPRDIDPEIKNIDKVVLYDLDTLNLIVAENHKMRMKEAEKAKVIIEEEVEKLWKRMDPPLLLPNIPGLGLARVPAG
ncbi:MAG: glutamyl-tRNA reductase [Caldiserica bacterium]|nr:glutamyl-tRNA reductase [Caldisericota bacterium]